MRMTTCPLIGYRRWSLITAWACCFALTPGLDCTKGGSSGADTDGSSSPTTQTASETTPVQKDRNDLTTMRTARITVGNHAFEVWMAESDEARRLGLMHVLSEQLAPLPDGTFRGMLFVFDREQPLAFWMYNTITPLDIAFIRSDGVIVKTHAMAPLETVLYPSVEPAQYALEVRAGTFAELGITQGQTVEIPDSVLKGQP